MNYVLVGLVVISIIANYLTWRQFSVVEDRAYRRYAAEQKDLLDRLMYVQGKPYPLPLSTVELPEEEKTGDIDWEEL